jgi:hypothetical protein
MLLYIELIVWQEGHFFLPVVCFLPPDLQGKYTSSRHLSHCQGDIEASSLYA